MQPRYNIAPTREVDLVHPDKRGKLEFDRGRWWLVQHFAKELPNASMFNARIETIDTSGAFRDGFQSRRCLVPADGYFEWSVSEQDGEKVRTDGAVACTELLDTRARCRAPDYELRGLRQRI